MCYLLTTTVVSLAGESLLLLTQPNGVTHHLLLKLPVNNSSKKLIPFHLTWPENLCALGAAGAGCRGEDLRRQVGSEPVLHCGSRSQGPASVCV